MKLSALVNLKKKISLHSTTSDMIDVPLILGAHFQAFDDGHYDQVVANENKN